VLLNDGNKQQLLDFQTMDSLMNERGVADCRVKEQVGGIGTLVG